LFISITLVYGQIYVTLTFRYAFILQRKCENTILIEWYRPFCCLLSIIFKWTRIVKRFLFEQICCGLPGDISKICKKNKNELKPISKLRPKNTECIMDWTQVKKSKMIISWSLRNISKVISIVWAAEAVSKIGSSLFLNIQIIK